MGKKSQRKFFGGVHVLERKPEIRKPVSTIEYGRAFYVHVLPKISAMKSNMAGMFSAAVARVLDKCRDMRINVPPVLTPAGMITSLIAFLGKAKKRIAGLVSSADLESLKKAASEFSMLEPFRQRLQEPFSQQPG